LLILCGFLSLCERKVFACCHLRVGPCLFWFGLFTPLSDGLKLFFKFLLFVVVVVFLFFFGFCFLLVFLMFLMWFLFPLGLLIVLDCCFSFLVFVCFLLLYDVLCVFCVGCFLFCSCFVYLSCCRVCLVSLLCDYLFNLLVYVFFVLDYFCFFCLKFLVIFQFFLCNVCFLGLCFLFLFFTCLLLDSLRLPFDYLECESELVCGLYTEFSGFLFVLFSLCELNFGFLMSLFFFDYVFWWFLVVF